jgi:hypothetical protein
VIVSDSLLFNMSLLYDILSVLIDSLLWLYVESKLSDIFSSFDNLLTKIVSLDILASSILVSLSVDINNSSVIFISFFSWHIFFFPYL